MKKRKKLQASVMLGAILILVTALIFMQFYQQQAKDAISNNTLLIDHFK